MNTDEINEFWEKYLLTLPLHERNQTYVEASSFGNSAELADRIAVLVRSGVKTTTSQLLWEQQIQHSRLDEPGDKSIVIDSQGHPVCIIEVEHVFILPFNQVDAEFVFAYGEGDRTMEFWNKNMWGYYQEECKELGKEARQDMPMICQVFKVIYKVIE